MRRSCLRLSEHHYGTRAGGDDPLSQGSLEATRIDQEMAPPQDILDSLALRPAPL